MLFFSNSQSFRANPWNKAFVQTPELLLSKSSALMLERLYTLMLAEVPVMLV